MGDLILLTATGGLLATIFWLGKEGAGGLPNALHHALLRPAVLALMALLLLLVALETPQRWPYTLTGFAGLTGIWESYRGVYQLLTAPPRRRSAVRQVQILGAWLTNMLANLVLLNLAAHLLFPSTFQWRDRPATLLDVAYFTVLTFASGGYGDVLPASAPGKLLAMLTSLCGLTYSTILFTVLFQRLRED